MEISRKQRAKINKVIKPFYITSNYLGTGLKGLLIFYSDYFARRRYPIQHFLPKFSSYRDRLTILFNAHNKKFGYASKRRPVTWKFYGYQLSTKYGHKKERKELKRKRKKERERRQKLSIRRNRSEKQQPVVVNALNESHKNDKIEDGTILLESSSSNSVEQNLDETHQNSVEKNVQQIETSTNHNGNDTVTIGLPKENYSYANVDTNDDEFDDEQVDNIWDLDIQEVAALITENGNDEKQLTEGMCQTKYRNSKHLVFGLKSRVKNMIFLHYSFSLQSMQFFLFKFDILSADDTNEDSLSNQNHHDEDGEISFSDSGPSNLSGICTF